jgi:hypothetical protein
MMRRCYDLKKSDYNYYGGRGITVCKRWHDFWKFVEDMEPRPRGYSIDRIDNNKGYTKKNTRWTTHTEQCRNRRSTVYYEKDGIKLSIKGWAEKLGVNYSTLRSRHQRHGNIFIGNCVVKTAEEIRDATDTSS